MSDKRGAKRISVELPVTVQFLDSRKKTRIGEPLAGAIRNYSPLGAAMRVATIMLHGRHLFYTCADNPEIVLELTFALSSGSDRIITIPARPVWFDRDLESETTQFDIGLKFLADARSPEIRALSAEACRDEKRLVVLWKRFF